MASFNDGAVAVAVSCGLLVEAVLNTAFGADAFVVAVPCGFIVIASFNEDAFAVAVAVSLCRELCPSNLTYCTYAVQGPWPI